MSSEMIVGIDLGTTNSLIAVWDGAKPVLIPNVHGEVLTPSVVGLDDDGSVLVGRAARERLLIRPHLTQSCFKRYMGTNKSLSLGDKAFRPEELSSFVLRSLKDDAEAYLGHAVREAVVTVPAYFSDAQRKATKSAGQLAGLKVDRVLNEPTAAALAYGIQNLDSESSFLVFDLGGGTFDVSVLEMFEGVLEVRSSAGDNYLGGEDFVDLLTREFIKRSGFVLNELSVDHSSTLNQRIRDQAERAKICLTIQPLATMKVSWDGKIYDWTFGEDEFLGLCTPLLNRLRNPVERALRDARIRSSDLSNVVLAGGATRMPIVRKLASRMFGRFPATEFNPDEVVARGAAVQAGLKMRDAALEEVVMTDVCPYSLGIDVSRRLANNQTSNGHYLPIIERNTPIPVSRVETLTTMSHMQREVVFGVFQGESRMAADNIRLGDVRLSVPPRPAGEVSIEVRFTYDVNGILEVESGVSGSGELCRVVITENPGVMSAEEVESCLSKLSDLKVHPRNQAQNRALLARAERLFEELLGTHRLALEERILAFQTMLETQDQEEIRAARRNFSAFLDAIERESWL